MTDRKLEEVIRHAMWVATDVVPTYVDTFFAILADEGYRIVFVKPVGVDVIHDPKVET